MFYCIKCRVRMVYFFFLLIWNDVCACRVCRECVYDDVLSKKSKEKNRCSEIKIKLNTKKKNATSPAPQSQRTKGRRRAIHDNNRLIFIACIFVCWSVCTPLMCCINFGFIAGSKLPQSYTFSFRTHILIWHCLLHTLAGWGRARSHSVWFWRSSVSSASIICPELFIICCIAFDFFARLECTGLRNEEKPKKKLVQIRISACAARGLFFRFPFR